jgi:large subunit ribosomal protein L23
VKGKSKRTARGMSRRKDWKKAYVRVANGQSIDFAPVE